MNNSVVLISVIAFFAFFGNAVNLFWITWEDRIFYLVPWCNTIAWLVLLYLLREGV